MLIAVDGVCGLLGVSQCASHRVLDADAIALIDVQPKY